MKNYFNIEIFLTLPKPEHASFTGGSLASRIGAGGGWRRKASQKLVSSGRPSNSLQFDFRFFFDAVPLPEPLDTIFWPALWRRENKKSGGIKGNRKKFSDKTVVPR